MIRSVNGLCYLWDDDWSVDRKGRRYKNVSCNGYRWLEYEDGKCSGFLRETFGHWVADLFEREGSCCR
jgi:hypothetical protein